MLMYCRDDEVSLLSSQPAGQYLGVRVGNTICSTCDGKGWTVPADGHLPGRPDNETCKACGGDGFTTD